VSARFKTAGRPVAFALAVLLAATPTASACPFCDGGPTGVNEVRREVFGPEFWPHLLAALAPFGVILTVVAAVLREPRRPRGPRPGREGCTDA
jgi:hypothetical protein